MLVPAPKVAPPSACVREAEPCFAQLARRAAVVLTNGVVELDTNPLSAIGPTVLIYCANKSDVSVGQSPRSAASGRAGEERAAASVVTAINKLFVVWRPL